MRAVIVGAGIAGLAAANGLRALGWDVAVFEQAPTLEPVGAGLSLSANALRALRELGLVDAVLAQAQRVERIDLLSDEGKLLQSTDLNELSNKDVHPGMVVLHRADLHRALLSGLPRSSIHTGMECRLAYQSGDRGFVIFVNGKSAEADLVLACDGIHSAVRRAIFPKSRERFARYTCWRAITNGIPGLVDPLRLTEIWGAGKRFGLAAIPGNRLYWFACCGADRMNAPESSAMDLPSLQALFADFHDPVPAVLAMTPPDSLIWTDILDLHPMPTFAQGRIVLLGDAAHAVTPDLGQGAGLALEDAAVLSSLLRKSSFVTAFREYDARRVSRAHKIATMSRAYARIAQWRNPLSVSLRNQMAKLIPHRIMNRHIETLLDFRPEDSTSPS